MKHGIHILFWMLIAALSSCTDDEIIDVPEPQPQTGIVIRLSAGDLEQTRTDLTSQANLQHVEKVYALLYRGHYKEGQTVEDTTKLIACDELRGWNPEDEGNGGPHGKEYKLPETENLTQGNYTVLCIGLDDNDEAPNEVGGSGETYNLPEAIRSYLSTKQRKRRYSKIRTLRRMEPIPLRPRFTEYRGRRNETPRGRGALLFDGCAV